MHAKAENRIRLGTVVLWLICSLGGTQYEAEGPLVEPDSLADISLHDALTFFAGYIAAPVVLAVAALDQLLRVGVVATTTAHQVTAVTANRCFVALPEKNRKLHLSICFRIKHFDI